MRTKNLVTICSQLLVYFPGNLKQYAKPQIGLLCDLWQYVVGRRLTVVHTTALEDDYGH
jgi:hypothetical protein